MAQTSVHLYHPACCSMATPPLSTPPVFSPLPSTAGAPLALAGVLILMAVLVAPEQPQDQEAICQRHNGVAACRVW